ncbi:hypothetical protein, partial [Mesorhizobium sp. M1252]|uniref:hypothetical protein n=1 Tax=Mesorhizobium sp. M1252 TaxID=2957073 RepID=UPI00333BA385
WMFRWRWQEAHMFASRRIPHRPTGQAQRASCKVPHTAAGPLAGSGYLLTMQSTKPVLISSHPVKLRTRALAKSRH